MYQQHKLLKLRKPILKYTLNKYHVHWLSYFKHLKLPISIKMANCLYLHDSYITKFDFMSYAFAKLAVAWLYLVKHQHKQTNYISHYFFCYFQLVSLLPDASFIDVISGLVSHDLPSIQRKAIELLNTKLQQQKEIGEDDVSSIIVFFFFPIVYRNN